VPFDVATVMVTSLTRDLFGALFGLRAGSMPTSLM
jgi:hypothetical protein